MNKQLWTDADFDALSWHDNILYSISFPIEMKELALDIDHVLECTTMGGNGFIFTVAPCLLVFKDVKRLKIHLEQTSQWGEYSIEEIKRTVSKKTLLGKPILWDYKIHIFGRGDISFTSSGFIQTMKANPVEGNSLQYKLRGLEDYQLIK